MAHFVAFCIGFQKNIPFQNPPGGRGVYMAAQGLIGQQQYKTDFGNDDFELSRRVLRSIETLFN